MTVAIGLLDADGADAGPSVVDHLPFGDGGAITVLPERSVR